MKKILKASSAIGLIGMMAFSGLAAGAANTASVAATVTFENVSVSVADGSIAYGTLAAGATENTSNLTDSQTATNNGNVAEDFNIKGSNTASWTLAGSAGSNAYAHKFCLATCGTPPTNYTALTTSYTSLGAGNYAVSGTRVFDLALTVPTTTADYTAQNADITVQATRH